MVFFYIPFILTQTLYVVSYLAFPFSFPETYIFLCLLSFLFFFKWKERKWKWRLDFSVGSQKAWKFHSDGVWDAGGEGSQQRTGLWGAPSNLLGSHCHIAPLRKRFHNRNISTMMERTMLPGRAHAGKAFDQRRAIILRHRSVWVLKKLPYVFYPNGYVSFNHLKCKVNLKIRHYSVPPI